MVAHRYVLMADDSGTGGKVRWTSDVEPPDLTPLAADTTPNFTGTLSNKTVVAKLLRLGEMQDVLDVNFSALANQTINADGVVAVDGLNWTKENSAADSTAMDILNGTGLRIVPVASSGLYPPGPTRTAPILRIDPTQLYPAFNFSTPMRLWCYFTLNNAANYDHLKIVVETATAATNLSWQVMRLSNTGDKWGVNGYYNGGALTLAYTTTGLTDDVMVMDLPAGILGDDCRLFTGVYSSGFPAASALRAQYRASPLADRDVTGQATTASAVNILLECGRDGSGTSLTGVVKRFRVQMGL